jgi:hypothetical protein
MHHDDINSHNLRRPTILKYMKKGGHIPGIWWFNMPWIRGCGLVAPPFPTSPLPAYELTSCSCHFTPGETAPTAHCMRFGEPQ